MKSTGLVRSIDELGRVVIPKELRRQMDITDGKDSLEIFVDGRAIILKKYDPSCIFCQSMDDLITYKEHLICGECAINVFNQKENKQ